MSALFLPRGIRNRNPGNIRRSKQVWQGMAAAQGDDAFVTFGSDLMGLRALMKLLLTYHRKYGLDTAESLINRYAPPAENATDHYIHAVAAALRVKRRDRLDLGRADTLITLARAIVRHENGPPPQGDWYADDLYTQAATLALKEQS
jgi:hypothetical protein